MLEHPRYQIVELIAQGDFATVYRGIDRDLDREVAIKQIHEQYLTDPKKLEQYWSEAQLLARLEHPYIMTIYDIVKERGWLILELMQGSLSQRLAGQPIDIEDLRLTLIYMCQALKFLQSNGIVHGDVKPSNLLLDKNHRVKLGDFGIARRLAQHDGSVVKGTTKYMAPEVVSDQFGDVGPNSDLYSLGFSAYELLCGEHFDSLFPGLNMYGRDPQVAWMMWHSAADRKLPSIGRVLEGVPDDQAKVIERMIEKDPKRRYQSADEVIFDLKAHSEGKDPDELKAEAELEEQKEAATKKRRRVFAYGAVAASMLLTLVMAFLPSGPNKEPDTGPQIPDRAILQTVDLERSELVMVPAEGGSPLALVVSEQDEISLNGQQSSLPELLPGDEVTIKDAAQFRLYKFTRPETESSIGQLSQVDAANGRVYVDIVGETEPIEVDVPFGIAPVLNGRAQVRGQPIKLGDLQEGDRVQVDWVVKGRRCVAVRLTAARDTTSTGTLLRMSAGDKTISVEVEGESEPIDFQLADDCSFKLNGTSVLTSGKVLSLADLAAGDQVTLTHSDEVQIIAAERILTARGEVKAITPSSRTLAVALEDPKATIAFRITDEAAITDASTDEVRPWSFVRVGDQVTLEHTSVDLIEPEASAVNVDPKVWDDRWALVVACGKYDDKMVSPLPTASRDADLLESVLQTYYRVPADQLTVLRDPTRLAMLERLQQILDQIGPNDQLILYFVGHGYLDGDGEAWLATKETELARIDETGLSLRQLIVGLEQVSTRETLLFLETCHLSPGEDRRQEPSTVELVDTLKRSAVHPVSTAVTVIASCDRGQRGQQLGPEGPNLFTQAVTDLWVGGEDPNIDGSLDADELILALPNRVAGLIGDYRLQPQTPIRFQPDDRPPRLTPEQKEAVLGLLEGLGAARFEEVFETRYLSMRPMLDNIPDGDLAYGLVSLKHNRRADSRRMFDRVLARFPDSTMAYQGMALQNAVSRRFDDMLEQLIRMVENLPEASSEVDEKYVASIMHMAGALRQFVLDNPEADWDFAKVRPLDELVLRQSKPMQEAFQAGVDFAREKRRELKQEIQSSNDESQQRRLEDALDRANTYAELDINVMADYLRFHLDDR